MAIDSAIPLQVKPPEQIDPLAQYGKLFQLQGMQQQAQAGALENQQRAQTLKDMQTMDTAWQQPGGREAVLNALPGHLKMKASQQFMEIDKVHAETQEAMQKAALGQADVFGMAAAGVRDHGYEPLAAQGFISDLKSKYAGDASTLQALQGVEQQIRANPTPEAIKPIIDNYIEKSKMARELDTARITANARKGAVDKPTEATLAVDAQNPQSATATASAAALDRLKPKPEPSLQSENVMLDGKPTQVTFNPKTGHRFDGAGQDVTGRTSPIPAASAIVNPQAQNDVKETVSGMKDGTLPPMMPGRATKEYLATMAEAHRQKYDLQAAVTDWNATQKHISTLNGSQQTRLQQSINALPDLLDTVDSLASSWKGGRFPPLNRANLALAKNGAYGEEVASVARKLDAQIADVTADLGNVYMGGNSPTDHALQLAGKSLSGDWSEKVLHDMVALAKGNVQIRQNSIKHTGVSGASPNNPYAPKDQVVPAPSDVIYARDPQGGLHQAKAGTPLPAGWKLEPKQ